MSHFRRYDMVDRCCILSVRRGLEPDAIALGYMTLQVKVQTAWCTCTFPCRFIMVAWAASSSGLELQPEEVLHCTLGVAPGFFGCIQLDSPVRWCVIAMDTRDPFKELTFDGRPGQYREFRRKVILSVAALEDKHQCLAGPKLLSRLSGEAWRCTEHLSIADVRSDRGWLTVLECLDKHYRHLPEVELHESIDDILFHLKKRPHEGTTAFSARFKTALSRLETLIHSEWEASKTKRRKRGDDKRRLTPASPVADCCIEPSPLTKVKRCSVPSVTPWRPRAIMCRLFTCWKRWKRCMRPRRVP